ncbi:hypothetical protein MNBD_GAMMA26-2234 [hydrothermal vent metagenome]|uniref:FimV N-terminal domain-containing protein n=1 Tax=hydrothermal vent metagenome TaxID=652676 RepID=A0A3B1BF06_9ZZZZ
MVRKLTLVLVLVVLSLPGSVVALGVGDVHLRSALDQAFDAEIDLLSVKSDELDGVKVQLASPEAFARIGIERPYFLTKLRFKPSLNAAGKAVIHVTSHIAIREPFLNFLIEVNWAKGRLVREYTVLLDPPVTLKNLPLPVAPPVIRAQAPVASPLRSTPSAAASKPLAEDYPVPDVESQASDYGPVQANETLWRIAMDTRLSGVTVQQMILAIQRNNPHAFYGKNVNNLKQGVILRIPTREEIDFISVREAQTQFSTQVDEWKGERVSASAAEIGTGVGSVDEEEPISDVVAPADDKLELASATLEDAVATGADEAETRAVARLENSLELAREENESAKQEQAELSEQVSELESQLADIERMLELRNDQLARIQAETAKNAEEGLLSELEAVQSTPTPQMDTAAQPDVAQSSDEDILSFIQEQIKQNLIVIAGVGGALVLLLLLILRRRQLADDDELQEGYFVADGTEATEVLGGETGEDTKIPSADEMEASLLSEFSHSEMDDVQDDTGEVDPVAEADVYIAYGRYQQAEELLRQAMQHNPDKLNSHFKLLEILFTKQDVDGFTALAEELHEKGAETQDAGAWKQAQAMGHSLNPGHALFASAPEADVIAEPEPVSEVVDDGGDFGLPDMDDSATDFDLNAELGEQDQQPVVDADSLDFNLDLGGGQSEDEAANSDNAEVDAEPFVSETEDLADALSNFTAEPAQVKADDGLEGSTEDKAQDTTAMARELEESLSAFTVDLDADAKGDEDLLGGEVEAASIEVPTLSLDDLGDLDILEAEAEVEGLGDDVPVIPMEDLDDIDISGVDISDLDDVGGAEEVLSELPELPEGSDFEVDLMTELSDEVGDADEVGTKLDLARAYVEMGDEEGARNILDEVISDGSDTQKKDGQELLKRLS